MYGSEPDLNEIISLAASIDSSLALAPQKLTSLVFAKIKNHKFLDPTTGAFDATVTGIVERLEFSGLHKQADALCILVEMLRNEFSDDPSIADAIVLFLNEFKQKPQEQTVISLNLKSKEKKLVPVQYLSSSNLHIDYYSHSESLTEDESDCETENIASVNPQLHSYLGESGVKRIQSRFDHYRIIIPKSSSNSRLLDIVFDSLMKLKRIRPSSSEIVSWRSSVYHKVNSLIDKVETCIRECEHFKVEFKKVVSNYFLSSNCIFIIQVLEYLDSIDRKL